MRLEVPLNFLKKPIDLEQLTLAVEKALEKLHLYRSLKYRNRELELAKELLVKVTVGKEIVVNLSGATEKSMQEFNENIIDALPFGLALLNENMEFCYAPLHKIQLWRR